MVLQTLEIGRHILAGFLTNLSIERLQLSIPVGNPSTQSRTLQEQQLRKIIAQEDIVTNLKICLAAYLSKNDMNGSQV